MFQLFDSTEKIVNQKKNEPIENKKAEVTIKNLKQGQCTVRIYHDENDNNKLDYITRTSTVFTDCPRTRQTQTQSCQTGACIADYPSCIRSGRWPVQWLLTRLLRVSVYSAHGSGSGRQHAVSLHRLFAGRQVFTIIPYTSVL